MPKSERVFQMLKIVQECPAEYDAAGLAKVLSISERGVYRYLRTLRNAGFNIKTTYGTFQVVDAEWLIEIVEKQRKIEALKDLISGGMVLCNPRTGQYGKKLLSLLSS
jgi:predicted DNA-binding transcriptional regulator YafY